MNLDQIEGLYAERTKQRRAYVKAAGLKFDATNPYDDVLRTVISEELKKGTSRKEIMAAMGTTSYNTLAAIMNPNGPATGEINLPNILEPLTSEPEQQGTMKQALCEDGTIQLDFDKYLMAGQLVTGTTTYRNEDGDWLPTDPHSEVTLAVEKALQLGEITIGEKE